MQQVPGYYESYFIRERIKEMGFKEFLKDVERDLAPAMEIKNYRIDFLE
jgi:hypothetical protein